MAKVKYPCKYLSVKSPYVGNLEGLPSFGPYGNLTGMRKLFGWEDAMPVKCRNMVYDCRTKPNLYHVSDTTPTLAIQEKKDGKNMRSCDNLGRSESSHYMQR